MDLSNIQTRISSIIGKIKPIYLVIVVAIILIIEGVWGYRAISQQGQTLPQINTPFTPIRASNVISLQAPKTQFKIGEVIPVTINIESNKLTAGADLIIHYDANLLSLPGSSASPVAVGNLYDEYPVNSADTTAGIIMVSGISNKTGGIIPKGLFGTILFNAKAAGSAKIFFEFTRGKTNDTNLIDSATSVDALEEVKNLDLTITQ